VKTLNGRGHRKRGEGTALDEPALRFEVRSQALRRLGLREHSRKELSDWLLRSFGPGCATVISEVLGALEQRGELCDARFAKALARHHEARGKGPAYIQAKLREKGVDRSVDSIRALLAESPGFGSGAERDLGPARNFETGSDEALTAVENPKDRELRLAVAVVERRYPGFRTEQRERARAWQALLRRGFSLEIVKKALEK
jgi:SOS response regulatory protein OraA/RecX